jgi:hypothetical protein
MIDWSPVSSSWVVAEAYEPETERILVRFKDGVEWYYDSCPPHVWEEFSMPGQSRGKYIHGVLKHKPNGRLSD